MSPIYDLEFDAQARATVTVASGFEGFIELEAEDITPTLMYVPPAERSQTRRLPVVPDALIDASAGILGLEFDRLGHGILIAQVTDCTGQTAAGVTMELSDAGESTTRFFGQLPDTAATATPGDGTGGFLNAPPGLNTLSAAIEDGGFPLEELRFVVRAGWASLVPIYMHERAGRLGRLARRSARSATFRRRPAARRGLGRGLCPAADAFAEPQALATSTTRPFERVGAPHERATRCPSTFARLGVWLTPPRASALPQAPATSTTPHFERVGAPHERATPCASTFARVGVSACPAAGARPTPSPRNVDDAALRTGSGAPRTCNAVRLDLCAGWGFGLPRRGRSPYPKPPQRRRRRTSNGLGRPTTVQRHAHRR